MQVIRKRVKTLKPSALKLPWHIWLSLNPESDATAIWLERKFDMPTSGSWVNESVFSIPLSSAGDPASTGYPGVIVFECTPLGEVTDDLEKYENLSNFLFVLAQILFTTGNIAFWMTVLDCERSSRHCRKNDISSRLC